MAQQAQSTPFNLVTPLIILSYSLYHLPGTFWHLLSTLQINTLLDVEAFKSAWFARFWAWFGPRARENAALKVKPLLENKASGVCLDVGPGSGQWLYMFAQALNPSITKIYGVEPNTGLHAELRANAVKAGLGDIYEIIGCGAEALIKRGELQPGSIDTIITVQCLCSIPEPEKNIRGLYPLLKSGGVWLVYEHIKTPYQKHFVAKWQRWIDVVWPHIIGGCEITRPTDEWLKRAGQWSEISLRAPSGEGPYDTIPHVVGYLRR